MKKLVFDDLDVKYLQKIMVVVNHTKKEFFHSLYVNEIFDLPYNQFLKLQLGFNKPRLFSVVDMLRNKSLKFDLDDEIYVNFDIVGRWSYSDEINYMFYKDVGEQLFEDYTNIGDRILQFLIYKFPMDMAYIMDTEDDTDLGFKYLYLKNKQILENDLNTKVFENDLFELALKSQEEEIEMLNNKIDRVFFKLAEIDEKFDKIMIKLSK